MLFLMQPRIQLAFWAVSSDCWVMLSFLSAKTPESFSSGLLSIHSLPRYICSWIPPTCVQDLALGLVELHEVCTGPPLKSIPLDGIPAFQHVNLTMQLGVIGKLAEGALNPTVHATDKDVKQRRSQN